MSRKTSAPFRRCTGARAQMRAPRPPCFRCTIFLRTLPNAGQVRGQFLAMYESSAPLCETAWGASSFCSTPPLCARAALALTAEARSLVQAEQALANYAPALEEDAAFFDAPLQDVRAARWDVAAVRVQGYAPPAFRAVRGYEGGSMDTVKALRTQVKALLAAARKTCLCAARPNLRRTARPPRPMRALLGAAELFEQVFTEKTGRKKLEYSDFEHLCPAPSVRGRRRKDARRKEISAPLCGRVCG